MFIEIYRKLEAQGPLSDEKIFDTALEMLQEKIGKEKDERSQAVQRDDVRSLTERFSTATTVVPDAKENVNLKDIFKD